MNTLKIEVITILSVAAIAAATACGGMEADEAVVQWELSLAEPGAFVETCVAGDFATGDIILEPSEPPYRRNPGDECTLISKYNGDIDGGFDVSGGNYDAFKQCMQDAGCYRPGHGTTRSAACDEKLKDCQEHLIGGGPSGSGGLEVERDFDVITADDWRKFGEGLNG